MVHILNDCAPENRWSQRRGKEGGAREVRLWCLPIPCPSEVSPPATFLEATVSRQLCFISMTPSSYPADWIEVTPDPSVANQQVATDIYMTGTKWWASSMGPSFREAESANARNCPWKVVRGSCSWRGHDAWKAEVMKEQIPCVRRGTEWAKRSGC